MTWAAIMWETMTKSGYRLMVWRGHDGGWRASVHYRHHLTGLEGKKTKKTFTAAQSYALKILKVYKKTRGVT